MIWAVSLSSIYLITNRLSVHDQPYLLLRLTSNSRVYNPLIYSILQELFYQFEEEKWKSVLYKDRSAYTFYWNRFRRISAITRLDWHFTPFHSSSQNTATFIRSVHLNLAIKRSSGFGSNLKYLTQPLILSDY